jgi:hypothetical protein
MILSGNPDPVQPFFLSNLFNFTLKSGQIWRVISPTGYIMLLKSVLVLGLKVGRIF